MIENVISTLENLLGLSPQDSSAGSFLQLNGQLQFQHDVEVDHRRWPETSFWIVGRELLLYHYLDLSSIPRKQRSKVLGQKTDQLSPFVDTGHYAIDQEGHIMLWLWDEELRKSAFQEALAGYSALANHILSLEVIPETLLHAKGQEGKEKVACTVGEDDQIWRSGKLVSSLWVNRIDGDVTADLEVEANFLGGPWTDNVDAWPVFSEQLLWRSGILILLLVAVFQMGSAAGFVWKSSTLSEQLESAREQVASLARIRSEVRSLKTRNNQLLESMGRYDQLSILAEFDGLIPQTATITEWIYLDETLRVQLKDKNLDNRDYLERLGNSRLFNDASIAPGSDAQSAIVSLEVGR